MKKIDMAVLELLQQALLDDAYDWDVEPRGRLRAWFDGPVPESVEYWHETDGQGVVWVMARDHVRGALPERLCQSRYF